MAEYRLNINLGGLLGKLQEQLQILSDLVIYGSSAKRVVKKEDYLGYKRFFNFLPAKNKKLNFKNVRNHFNNWCLINSFRDAVECISNFIESCNIVCSLMSCSPYGEINGGMYNKITGKEKDKFHSKGLPYKICFLEKKYNIKPELTEHVLSLNKVRNCLVHRLGVVGKKDVNKNDVLIAKWRKVQILVQTPDGKKEKILNKPSKVEGGGNVCIRNKDVKRLFKLNNKITFSEKEHVDSLWTFFWYGQAIVKSIGQYKERQLKEPKKRD